MNASRSMTEQSDTDVSDHLAEGYVQGRKPRGLEPRTHRHEALDGVAVVPFVDVHPGLDAAVLQPEREPSTLAALARLAADDDLGRNRRIDPAAVLHAQVVLVGVDERRACVVLRIAEDGFRQVR